MAGVYELTYRDGHKEELWSEDNCYYVLGPDHLRRVESVPAWCYNCDAIEVAERLRSRREIELEIQDCDDPNSAFVQKHFGSSPPERLLRWKSGLTKELAHSSQRKSPPRCLTCGRTDLNFFIYSKWAPHPKLPEEVFFICVGIGSTSVHTRFFDSEGVGLVPTEAEMKHFRTVIRENTFDR
jgi:hypothetical protein